MLKTLDELAIVHKADKSSLYHNFAEKYDRLFAKIRHTATSILEIGVLHGSSMKMWADYFTNASIHGADIALDASCQSYSGRIHLHLIDQSNADSLRLLQPFSPFDVIIDDGNHFWKEQIITFETLFPYLRSGGIYVVEDSCTSYWSEYGNHSISAVEFFKGVVDVVNLYGARSRMPLNPSHDFDNWDKGWHRREDCHSQLPEFESIHFLNSIIIIHKRS